MFSVRSATFGAHRVPSQGGRSPKGTGAPFHVGGAAVPDSQHCQSVDGSCPSFRPTGGLARGPSGVYFAA